jgi:hypothetical protein
VSDRDPLVMALTAHGQVVLDLVWALKHARRMALTCERDDADAFWAELEVRIKDNHTLDSANKDAWALRARPENEGEEVEAGL